MMTVRFASGLCVQYNDARWLVHGADDNALYTKQGGDFIAVVPKDCIVEAVSPCRIYRAPMETEQDVARELRLLRRRIPAPKRRRKP